MRMIALAILAGLLIWAVWGTESEDVTRETSGSSETVNPATDVEDSRAARLPGAIANSSPARSAPAPLRFRGHDTAREPQASTGEQLFAAGDVGRLAMKRIQSGLSRENGDVLQLCLGEIAATTPGEAEVIEFEMSLDIFIDSEVGIINDVRFEERPRALSDANMDCLVDSFRSLTFDGSDSAFEGSVAFPVRYVIPASTEGG